jgi:hypothetical protein
MNARQSSELFAVLVSLWPNNKADEATGRLYGEALADLDYELARRAVGRLARIAKWFPTVAEIREQAVNLEQGATRKGLEAWGDVVAEIRRTGSYGSPRFSDPLVCEALRGIGTWRDICLSTNDTADRARFVELYDAIAARGRTEAAAGPLSLPSPKASRDVTRLIGNIGREIKSA